MGLDFHFASLTVELQDQWKVETDGIRVLPLTFVEVLACACTPSSQQIILLQLLSTT